MDMSKKTTAQLEKMMNADSGLDATTVRAAYKELSKRKDLDFPVQMVTGGRDEKNPDAPPPRPKNLKKKKMMGGGYTKKTEMMYGGMAKGKKHMYAAGGSVSDKMKKKSY
jgi:hypothetical protein